jgi:hypothetical protein
MATGKMGRFDGLVDAAIPRNTATDGPLTDRRAAVKMEQ